MPALNKKLILLALLRSRIRIRQKKHIIDKPKRKHRWWVRSWLARRPDCGQFATLVQELKNQDREYFYRYTFDDIVVCTNFVAVVVRLTLSLKLPTIDYYIRVSCYACFHNPIY